MRDRQETDVGDEEKMAVVEDYSYDGVTVLEDLGFKLKKKLHTCVNNIFEKLVAPREKLHLRYKNRSSV
jgi:hypothetical protein